MSANLTKASKKSRLPVSSLLPRIAIYSAVVAGIIASFYDFKLNTFFISSEPKSSEAKQYINGINKGQQAYYAENGQFSDSIATLGVGLEQQTKNYNYTIVSSMGPVQTLQNQREPAQFESAIAIAKPNDMNGKSYTGAVFAFKEPGSDMITIAAICESDSINASYAETWSPPTFDGKKIHCQPGTTMLLK
ncbi:MULTISPECIES: type IV pilin-like G/H family protein [unclassified Microcoleus]|uniref:type IV pilin-like G/H family protein n=1 Tax=unclassified Microcoleus TaxID=2642155 RepID=UPI0025FE96E9|nr:MULTISPECIES: type IV pilin-like G/H family protein [unclassified Microcoleus]